MARNVSVIVTDDLDGTAGAETVSFSLVGVSYEIDLAEASARKLRDALAPFAGAARRVSAPRQARPANSPAARTDRAAVRARAAGQGLHVSGRGRISASVMARYEAAH